MPSCPFTCPALSLSLVLWSYADARQLKAPDEAKASCVSQLLTHRLLPASVSLSFFRPHALTHALTHKRSHESVISACGMHAEAFNRSPAIASPFPAAHTRWTLTCTHAHANKHAERAPYTGSATESLLTCASDCSQLPLTLPSSSSSSSSISQNSVRRSRESETRERCCVPSYATVSQ